jgi:hypothetical protein
MAEDRAFIDTLSTLTSMHTAASAFIARKKTYKNIRSGPTQNFSRFYQKTSKIEHGERH